jgi:hypothetical protein
MLGYIGLMLVLPITAMLTKASSIPLDVFMARATEPVALSAYFVSFSVALAAAAINAVFGFVLAWVLVKYKFPGEGAGAGGGGGGVLLGMARWGYARVGGAWLVRVECCQGCASSSTC